MRVSESTEMDQDSVYPAHITSVNISRDVSGARNTRIELKVRMHVHVETGRQKHQSSRIQAQFYITVLEALILQSFLVISIIDSNMASHESW